MRGACPWGRGRSSAYLLCHQPGIPRFRSGRALRPGPVLEVGSCPVLSSPPRFAPVRIRESEFGQGAAEYAGIVVVALGVVAAVVAAFSGFDIKQKVIDALTSVFGAPAG